MTGEAGPRGARSALDLRLYLITDREQCSELGVVDTVRAALHGGVTAVQLRDPAASDAELVALGRDIAAELRGSNVPLLVDDRVDLVSTIGADGAHVGQGDMPADDARAMLGEQATLGLSVGTLDEFARAGELAPGTVDYLGVGPVWGTASKPDHAPPIGLTGLSDIASRSPWPVVAIGGISLARTAAVRRSGAQGIAVISAVCAQQDPTTASRDLLAAWEGATP
ncbi:MAG: thiamine phosphate synthase [Ornithinimicrobium sp.]